MDHTLTDLLRESCRAWSETNALYAQWAKRHHMTSHTLYTLYALYESEDGCRPGDICDRWSIPKQTVSSLLKGLLDQGYLNLLPDPADRRGRILTLTPAGRAYARCVVEPLQALELSALEEMTQAERTALLLGNQSYCRLLRQAMEEEFP